MEIGKNDFQLCFAIQTTNFFSLWVPFMNIHDSKDSSERERLLL